MRNKIIEWVAEILMYTFVCLTVLNAINVIDISWWICVSPGIVLVVLIWFELFGWPWE